LIKHVDIVAVAVLLAGAALYSEARQVAVVRISPYDGVKISQVLQRAMRCSRSAKATRAVTINRAVVTPWCSPKVTATITSD
jgi:hypothetical protein